MATPELETTARAIVADGKGILAADETPGTLTTRLIARGIESTPDTRRAYREMFFSTQGVAEFISGVILQDETIRQRSSKGTLLPDLLARDPVCRDPFGRHRGQFVPATVADHVTPVRLGGQWTEENGQGLCASCHAEKRRRERP